MKIRHAVCALLLAVPAIALADKTGCDSVNFGADVIAKFPNVKLGCQDVKIREDGVYAHFKAEVVGTDKDGITVKMLDRDGKPYTKVKFAPAADQSVSIAGKDTKYADLKKGDQIDFYIEQSKWGLFGTPDGKRMTILSREPL